MNERQALAANIGDVACVVASRDARAIDLQVAAQQLESYAGDIRTLAERREHEEHHEAVAAAVAARLRQAGRTHP